MSFGSDVLVQLCGYSGAVEHKEGGKQVLLLLSLLPLHPWWHGTNLPN